MPQKLPLGKGLLAVCLMRIRKGSESTFSPLYLLCRQMCLVGVLYATVYAGPDSSHPRTGTMSDS